MEKFLGLPFDASAHGHLLDHAVGLIHVIMLILFLLGAMYYIIALIRFRKSKNPVANYIGVKSSLPFIPAIALAITEGMLLAFVDVPLWASVTSVPAGEENPMMIRVVAEQFAWNIHYAGQDRKFGRTDIKLISAENPIGLDRADSDAKDDVTTINQFHIPVDRQIVVQLSTKDMIHSFSIPVLRVKRDAIPGQRIAVPFKAIHTGNFEIACAQLCGLGHYRMRGFVTIETPEAFDNWIKEESAALITQAN